jgi:HEAT repeat protein
MFAASTLGKTRDRSAIPHLARILKHDDINVCQAAIESLGELRAVSTLDELAGLLQGHTWLRVAVVHTLGEIADQRSIPTLLGLLDDDQLRDSAIDALGKIGGIKAINALVRQLEVNRSPAEFKFCLEALGSALVRLSNPGVLQELPAWVTLKTRANKTLAPRLSEILRVTGEQAKSADSLVTREAAIDLVRCLRVEPCYPDLIAAAADPRLGEVLLFAVAEIGRGLEKQLTAAISHENGDVRKFACRAIAAVSGESGAKALVSLLTDADDTTRAAAIGVLGRMHQADALPDIVERLSDESKAVRKAVIRALARMDARVVTMALLRNRNVLADKPLEVLSVMRSNPHPMQKGFVETSLAHADATVRGAAVAAFAAQGTNMVETLEPMLADRSAEVRRSAITALGRCPCERTRQLLLDLLERDAEVRLDVIRALGQVGDARVVPRVIAIFDACSAEEQVFAIDLLEAIEPAAAEPFLARQLDHQDPRIRRHAVKALVRIGTTSALRRIVIALRDENPRVRMTVSKALASCPHPIARNTLERLSVDPVESVAAFARSQF